MLLAAGNDKRPQLRAIDLREPFHQVGRDNHEFGPAIGDYMGKHIAAIGGVDRHIDRAEPVDREPDAHHVDAVRQPDVDVVALLDAKRGETRRRALHGRAERSIAYSVAVRQAHKGFVWMLLRALLQHIAQHAIFAAGHSRVHGFRLIRHIVASLVKHRHA